MPCTIYAKDDTYNYTSFNEFKDKIDSVMGQSPDLSTKSTVDDAANYSQMLSISGPLQFSTIFSETYGFTLNTSYNKLLNKKNSLSIEADIGSKENRLNLTAGHAFSPKNRIKFTAEGLGQNQTFLFDSGDVDQWVYQFAGGSEFQRLIGKSFFNNVAIGGYYARSFSQSLGTVLFNDNNANWINYRNIGSCVKFIDLYISTKLYSIDKQSNNCMMHES